MPSGGARARSGPAPDPLSKRSMDRGWINLPESFDGEVPGWPFEPNQFELDMWRDIWTRPQAYMWSKLGLQDQVAAYVRAYLESVQPEAKSTLKTAVLRMETELGISIAGMRQNGWRVALDVEPLVPSAVPVRQTSTGNWLGSVTVDGEGA